MSCIQTTKTDFLIIFFKIITINRCPCRKVLGRITVLAFRACLVTDNSSLRTVF